MPDTDILLKLRELHDELASINDDLKSVDEINDETVDSLANLMTEISETIDQKRVDSAEHVATEHHDLHDRIMQLETDHPRITRFLSQMTDLLAMMGI